MTTIAEQLLNLYEIKRDLADKLNSYGVSVTVDSAFESFIDAVDSVIKSPAPMPEGGESDVKLYLNKTLTTARSSNVTSVVDYSFYGFSSLYTVDFPNVNYVGHHAFQDCTSLRNLTLGSITSLGSAAFNNCKNLKKIWIPKSCVTMNCNNYGAPSELIFYNCTGLTVYTEFTSRPSGWTTNWNKTQDSNSTPSVSVKWGATYQQYLNA